MVNKGVAQAAEQGVHCVADVKRNVTPDTRIGFQVGQTLLPTELSNVSWPVDVERWCGLKLRLSRDHVASCRKDRFSQPFCPGVAVSWSN